MKILLILANGIFLVINVARGNYVFAAISLVGLFITLAIKDNI